MIDFEAPSIFKRLATLSYDSLLLIAVSMAYGGLYIGIKKLLGAEEDGASSLLFQLGWLCTIFCYFALFWLRGNQTTGMRAWKTQIITADGGCPKLTQCLLRFVLAPVGWLLFITYFFDERKQLLHDHWSKTYLTNITIAKAKKKK